MENLRRKSDAVAPASGKPKLWKVKWGALEGQMGVQGEGKARAHSPPHLSPYPCSEAPVPPAV